MNYSGREKYNRQVYSAMSEQFKSRDALKNYQYKTRKRKKRGSGPLAFFLILIIVIGCTFVVYGVVKFASVKIAQNEEKKFDSTQMRNDIYIDYSVLGFDDYLCIKGMTKQEVYDKVRGSYSFNMSVTNSNPELSIFEMPVYGENIEDENLADLLTNSNYDNLGTSQEVTIKNPLSNITINATKEEYKLPDFIDGQIKAQIDEIYDAYLYKIDGKFNKNGGRGDPDFVFTISTQDDYLDDCLMQISRLWNTKAVKGQIEGFDSKKNEFIFGDDHNGYEIDQLELKKRIVQEANKGHFNATIDSVLNIYEPTGETIKSKYKYVTNYETMTTDNETRNMNIDLACRAINGTIVKPGMEFSFNNVVGERTEQKGYGYAPAYNQGMVVEELGGGVCQVSTTLYNAVFMAGLTTTYRRSHTFEPTYIRPGLDATVSFHGPDYKFINDSEYSVGIRAQYTTNRKKNAAGKTTGKVKVEIFAVPILSNGITQTLVSNKLEDLDYPAISIIDEGKATKGTRGSEWQVFKVVKSGDTEIEKVHDHYAKYQGYTPTAYEDNTYIDKEGILQTYSFREGPRNRNSTKKQTEAPSATIRMAETTEIAPRETEDDNRNSQVEQLTPNGSRGNTPQ